MNFIVDKKTILSAIQSAQEVVASKTFISILSNVYLGVVGNELTIRTTDSNINFESRIPVENLGEEERCTVHCEKCYRSLHSLPHERLSIKVEKDSLSISPMEGEVTFTLRTLSADEFPSFQYLEKDTFFTLPQSSLIELIDSTIFAVSDDETRFFMNGVNMQMDENYLLFVATDGKRLSSAKVPILENTPAFESAIVPPKVLRLVRKLLGNEGDVRIAIQDRHIHFSVHNILISSVLIEGPFPDYKRVIPDTQEYSLSVDSGSFRNALKRVALFAEKSKRVFCTFAPHNILLHSEEVEIGHVEESISCNYEGPEFKFAFNYQYLLDPLLISQEGEFSIRFSDPSKVISIPESDAVLHIVMPMRTE